MSLTLYIIEGLVGAVIMFKILTALSRGFEKGIGYVSKPVLYPDDLADQYEFIRKSNQRKVRRYLKDLNEIMESENQLNRMMKEEIEREAVNAARRREERGKYGQYRDIYKDFEDIL